MAPGKATSLTEYATARGSRRGRVPWMETLPDDVLKEAIDGYVSGISSTVIAEWLRGEGYEATHARVDGYFTSRGYRLGGARV